MIIFRVVPDMLHIFNLGVLQLSPFERFLRSFISA